MLTGSLNIMKNIAFKLIKIQRNGHWYIETEYELRGPFTSKEEAKEAALERQEQEQSPLYN